MKSQFDFGTIIGLVAGLLCIFVSMIWPEVDRGDIILSTGDSWRFEQLIWFFQPQSVFIVLGGVLSATLVNYPIKAVINIGSVFKNVILSEKFDFTGTIDKIVILAEKSLPKAEELSDKQKKYQAFFTKALKKFGVDSPAELDDKKKKEFFDYVDKNYEADNEEDEMEPVKETTITISPTEINKLTSMSEKKVTVDIDWIGDPKFTKDTEKKFKIKFKVSGSETPQIFKPLIIGLSD